MSQARPFALPNLSAEHRPDRASTRAVVRTAVVVTPRSLEALEHALRTICNPGDSSAAQVRYSVFAAGEPAREFEKREEVVGLRNPKAAAIYALAIRAESDDGVAHLLIDNTGTAEDHAALSLVANHESAERLSNALPLLNSELRNIAAWYRVIRWPYDWLAVTITRTPRWAWIALILTFAIVLVAGATASYLEQAARKQRYLEAYAAWEESYNTAMASVEDFERRGIVLPPDIAQEVADLRAMTQPAKQPSSLPDEQVEQSTVAIWDWLGPLLTGMFLGLVPLIIRGLFPRAIFRIGEGNDRYDDLRKIRLTVLVSILFCGLVLPIARKWATGA
jgi:hypothetical protein